MLTANQIKEIRVHLEKAQNPLFFFDNDNDGLCSFLLLQRYIDKGKGFPIKTSPELTEDYFRKINELKPDYLFILDQPEVSEGFFKRVREINLPVVWIDHHNIDRKKIPKFVNYYNPVFNTEKSNEPVTALCYQISNKKEDRWIAIVGCISDKFVPKYYLNFKKDFPDLSVSSEDAFEIYYNSQIGKIATIFCFALMDRTTNVINMLKFLRKVKSPYEVLEDNSQTHSMHKRFRELYSKYQKLIDKAKKQANTFEKIIFFKYSGDISMSAEISNKLKYLFPEKIIAVAKISGSRVGISIRGKNIREPVLKVLENFEGATGGGHEAAVGIQISFNNLDRFQEELIKALK